jgi:predicted MPP superfamily phosphohydrolase
VILLALSFLISPRARGIDIPERRHVSNDRGNVPAVARSIASYLTFVAVLGAVVGIVHLYLWLRLVRSPALGARAARWGTRAVASLAALVPAAMLLAIVAPRWLEAPIFAGAYAWLGFALLLFFLFVGGEVVRAAITAGSALAGAPLDPARRTFLSRAIAAAAASLAAVLGVGGLASALGGVAVRGVRVSLARLPRAMSGFRIAQITDLHVGPTIGRAFVEDVVARINAAEPDLVAITGDLVDGSVADLREHVAPLAGLRAPHGVFFVTGNHEYYSGADEWIAELARLGVRVLRNERVPIGDEGASFDLAGVDDASAHRHARGHGADLDRALAGRDPTRELVLLAHQPKQVREASRLGVGLQISGHTHGGQIFPWGLFVQLDQPFIAGLDALGATQIYVSTGAGYWGPPMRVGAPPEVALIELHAPEDA